MNNETGSGELKAVEILVGDQRFVPEERVKELEAERGRLLELLAEWMLAHEGIYMVRSGVVRLTRAALWVKTSDRLPTRGDADESGSVWCAGWSLGKPVVTAWSYYRADEFDYWMPKPRQQPPEPPEVE